MRPDDAILVGPEQAAVLLGMARSQWDTLVRAGDAPAPLRLGSEKARPKWSIDELRAWAAYGCPPAANWGPVWRKLLTRDAWRPQPVELVVPARIREVLADAS